ncbi:sodium/calcium exchanger protein [Rhizoctonia solani 123E]|uniref:Sodium/calcium exchanger protein n=1 Tax=Rhizoctonia solani 123E TaxID=1423351 RepID=A0A074RMR1_9AGAM|nr:sodium/calcium exchanger protein [Rhizoctonia solani 123E]
MMPSARTPPDSDQYLPLREGVSPPPQIHVPIEGFSHHDSAPLTPEPQPMSQASVDEMHRTQDADLAADERANPSAYPHERRHVQPISHRRIGSAPDPWSPGYQRNTQRFSLGTAAKSNLPTTGVSGNSKPSHPRSVPLYAHHRHGSTSPDAPVRIRRKSPGLMNFFRKLNGERVRERGHKVPGIWQSLKAIVLSSWLNILFVFLPFSWIAALAKWNYVYTFILSFIAIIPLENISEYGGEQLALYCGESIGDLIVITLHNIVEAVLAIVLLVKCELKLLQSTVIGVVLLHCLLVPGTAFLTDGTKLWAQQLKPRVTELNQSLLTVGVLALVVPTGFFAALPYKNPAEYAPQFINYTDTMMSRPGTAPTRRDLLSSNLFDLNKRAPIINATHKASVHAIEIASSIEAVSDATRDWLLRLSRGISIILLVIYIGSRIYLHNPPGEHIVVETVHTTEDHDEKDHAILYDDLTPRNSFTHVHTLKKTFRNHHSKDEMEEDRERLISQVEREHGASEHVIDESAEHHHPPELNPWIAVVLLVIVIGLLSVTAEWLVKSIEPIREERLFTSEWFGLILLPLVSYAGDGLNTIMYFIRTNLMKMHMEPPNDLAKAKSIDLSIQFTLFWIPVLVLVGWALNEPLTLLFDHFEVIVVVGASFLVNSVTQDGRTNWSEGTIMVGFYVIIGLAAWYYPGDAEAHFLLQCKSMEELLSKPPF